MSNHISLMMKMIAIGIGLVFFSCSDNSLSQKEDIVLTINDLKITRSEFNAQCEADMEYTENFKKNKKVRQEALNSIIRKELLIQEAKKMGLDQDLKFIAAIERYWEATLIKQLMEKKNSEIQQSTTVSEKEIRETYEAYKAKNASIPPLDTVKKEITDEILEAKTAKKLENWMESLRENASINIHNQIFTE